MKLKISILQIIRIKGCIGGSRSRSGEGENVICCVLTPSISHALGSLFRPNLCFVSFNYFPDAAADCWCILDLLSFCFLLFFFENCFYLFDGMDFVASLDCCYSLDLLSFCVVFENYFYLFDDMNFLIARSLRSGERQH